MKKISFILSALTLIGVSVFAQTTEKISGFIESRYDGAEDVEIYNEESEIIAEFFHLEQAKSASFDGTGKWQRTEFTVSVDEVPAICIKQLEGNFAGFTVDEVTKVEDETGEFFEFDVSNDSDEWLRVTISSDGKLLGSSNEEPEEDPEVEW